MKNLTLKIFIIKYIIRFNLNFLVLQSLFYFLEALLQLFSQLMQFEHLLKLPYLIPTYLIFGRIRRLEQLIAFGLNFFNFLLALLIVLNFFVALVLPLLD